MPFWSPFAVVLSVFFSLACAVFAWSCRPGKHRHIGLEKRVRELESDAVDLADGWKKCLTQLKRINQREVMRDRRKAEKENPNADDLSDEEWLAQAQASLLQKTMGNN